MYKVVEFVLRFSVKCWVLLLLHHLVETRMFSPTFTMSITSPDLKILRCELYCHSRIVCIRFLYSNAPLTEIFSTFLQTSCIRIFLPPFEKCCKMNWGELPKKFYNSITTKPFENVIFSSKLQTLVELSAIFFLNEYCSQIIPLLLSQSHSFEQYQQFQDLYDIPLVLNLLAMSWIPIISQQLGIISCTL